MAIVDLPTLLSAVSRWAGGSSDTLFADACRDAVALCEADLNNGLVDAGTGLTIPGLRVPELTARALLVADKPYERLPPDFAAVVACSAIDSSLREWPMREVHPDAAATLAATSGALPQFYSLTGGQIRLLPGPVAPATVSIRLVYRQRVPSLLDPQPTTAILAAYPSVYLYGTLRHLAGYVQDDVQLARWTALFAGAVRGANRAGRDR